MRYFSVPVLLLAYSYFPRTKSGKSKLFKDKLPMVKNLNIDLSKRPEELSNETFYKIAKEYEKLFG